MKRSTALILAGAVTLGLTSAAHAQPDPAPVGAPTVTAPVANDLSMATPPVVPAPRGPSAELDDPLTNPGGAYRDLVAAKDSGGWALALLAGLVMLARMATRLPGGIGAWLGVGTRATVVGIAAAGAIAAYDTLALGGRLGAVLFAIIGAVLALMWPAPKRAEVA